MSSKSIKSCNMPLLKHNIRHELRLWHDWNGQNTQFCRVQQMTPTDHAANYYRILPIGWQWLLTVQFGFFRYIRVSSESDFSAVASSSSSYSSLTYNSYNGRPCRSVFCYLPSSFDTHRSPVALITGKHRPKVNMERENGLPLSTIQPDFRSYRVFIEMWVMTPWE